MNNPILVTIAATWFAIAMVLVAAAPRVLGARASPSMADFFYAIAEVESRHDDGAVGDGGESLGRYQIQRAYWLDAVRFDRSIGGEYEDVKNPCYARKIMRAYFERHAPRSLGLKNFETLARIHNGGPYGHLKPSTSNYWSRVEKAMQEGNARRQKHTMKGKCDD